MKSRGIFFGSEFSRGIKSTKFISLLIIGIVACLLLYYSLLSTEANRIAVDQQSLSERPNFIYTFYFGTLIHEYPSRLDDQTIEVISKSEELAQKAEKFYQENDLASYYYTMAELNLIAAKQSFQGVLSHPGSATLQEREKWEAKLRRLWTDVDPSFKYDDISFSYTLFPFIEEPDKWLFDTEYYYRLSLLDVPSLPRESVSGWSLFYQFSRKILPYWIIICSLIISIDSIRSDLETGAIKTILTSGITRFWYLTMKTSVSWLLSFLATIFPASVISFIYGVNQDPSYLNYPVLFLTDGWSSLRTIPSYLNSVKPKLGFDFYSGISLTPVDVNLSPIYDSTEWITLKEMYAGILLLSLLSILFYVLAFQLSSILFKNRIIAFGLSSLLAMAAVQLSSILTHGQRINLSPFSMNDPVRILGGLHNVTPITSLLVLLVSVATFFLLSSLIWRRKHF